MSKRLSFSYVVKVQDGPELLIRPQDGSEAEERTMIANIRQCADENGVEGRLRGWAVDRSGPSRINLGKGQWVHVPSDAIMYIGVKEGDDE